MSHTPGPWVKSTFGELLSPGGKIVTVWGCGIAHGGRTDETEANARLIAQAPRMLEALKIMVDSAVPHPVEHPTMTEAWRIAREVISAAESD